MTNSSTGTSTQIVQKLWNYCNVLRDDAMSYGDYPAAKLPSTELRAGVSFPVKETVLFENFWQLTLVPERDSR